MKNIKRKMLRVLFAIELVAFGSLYVYGPYGMQVQHQLEKENELIVQEAKRLEQEIDALHHTIAQWDAHPYYKEKIAREQLQMARKDDHIYYIS